VLVQKREELELDSEEQIVRARQEVRRWAIELGFSLVAQTKLVTAASELARNAVVYGGGGKVELIALQKGSRRGLQVVFSDKGPGIADIELAMKDGYTTGTGLGLGLGGAKRLVNEFEIESRPGEGTRVSVTSWR
jgi:serine/threonine-protein kinase RsbT